MSSNRIRVRIISSVATTALTVKYERTLLQRGNNIYISGWDTFKRVDEVWSVCLLTRSELLMLLGIVL